MPSPLTVYPITGIPLVAAGDDIATLVLRSLEQQNLDLEDGDVVVVAQKIVSKSEDRLVRLSEVRPSDEARVLGDEIDKDPRLVELILRESVAIVRKAPGVLIVRNRLGIIGANAGIDQSNVDHREGECALLLPEDPDGSAVRLRDALQKATSRKLGVIISDSANRPWRIGTLGQAIGAAGITVLDDRCGRRDLFGRELQVTVINRADSIATAAVLVMGETTERVPAALVRGLPPDQGRQNARASLRPEAEDLFL